MSMVQSYIFSLYARTVGASLLKYFCSVLLFVHNIQSKLQVPPLSGSAIILLKYFNFQYYVVML